MVYLQDGGARNEEAGGRAAPGEGGGEAGPRAGQKTNRSRQNCTCDIDDLALVRF